MLPFTVVITPGESPYRQVVYAATKAVLSGELAPGSPFPSVRDLSHALKINPNTAQKVIAELARDGLIEVRPGIGTVVATSLPSVPAAERRRLVAMEIERVVVEAKRLGLTESEVTKAVSTRWKELFGS